MIHVAIVDDELPAINRLVSLCKQLPDIKVVGAACDAASALRLVEQNPVDVVLLDIRMPNTDGLSLATSLGALGRKAPAVVFVTAHADFAVTAFEMDAADYLLKPASVDRLKQALQRAADRRKIIAASTRDHGHAPYKTWWVPNGNELTRLRSDDIELITAERDYVRLHACRKSYLLRDTMASIEQALDPAVFLRVHRSTIVRRDAIEALRHQADRWTLRTSGGFIVFVGRNHLPRLRAELTAGVGSPRFCRRVISGDDGPTPNIGVALSSRRRPN